MSRTMISRFFSVKHGYWGEKIEYIAFSVKISQFSIKFPIIQDFVNAASRWNTTLAGRVWWQ